MCGLQFFVVTRHGQANRPPALVANDLIIRAPSPPAAVRLFIIQPDGYGPAPAHRVDRVFPIDLPHPGGHGPLRQPASLALVFGFVYLKVGRNIWATVIAHATLDSLAMTVVYLGYADALGG